MTPEEERNELGVRAWRVMAEEMKRQGAVAAFHDMLVRAPQTLREMVEWMDEQPIERRKSLCDEAFGKLEEPRRR